MYLIDAFAKSRKNVYRYLCTFSYYDYLLFCFDTTWTWTRFLFSFIFYSLDILCMCSAVFQFLPISYWVIPLLLPGIYFLIFLTSYILFNLLALSVISLSLNLEFQLQSTFSHFFWAFPGLTSDVVLHGVFIGSYILGFWSFQKIHIKNGKEIFSFKKPMILWYAYENNATCSIYLDLKKIERKTASVNQLLSLRKYVSFFFTSPQASLVSFKSRDGYYLAVRCVSINHFLTLFLRDSCP